MGTTARVLSGSLTKVSSAKIVYPDEHSGSNTLKRYDQGVYVNDIDTMLGSTILKLRPNNDFLPIVDGKTWLGDLRPFDDESAPSSFMFMKEPGAPTVDGKPAPIGSGSNHYVWHMMKSQITMSPGDGSRAYVTGSKYVKASGLGIAPNHFRDDRDLGQTDIFQDATPFKDTANNDPLNIVTTDPLVIDYPINLVCQSDVNLMDGAMEPFPLRSVIDHSILEVPYTMRGIRASVGPSDSFRRSVMMDTQVPSVTSRTVTRDGRDFIKGCDPYLDGVEVFGLEILDMQGEVTASLTYDYDKTIVDMASGSNAFGPVYKTWWDKFKIKDLINPVSSSGPIAMPGFLYKPSATIPPFRDGTDREDVTALIKDESVTPAGSFGLLDFTFPTPLGKYQAPPVTASLSRANGPGDLTAHLRLTGDGTFGSGVTLKSSTQGTKNHIFAMFQTGTLWTLDGNSLASSPYIDDMDARAVIPTFSEKEMLSGSLSPTGLVITSSLFRPPYSGATATYTSSGSNGQPLSPSGSAARVYHSLLSPTIPGTRIARLGTGIGTASYTEGSRFHSGSFGDVMGLVIPYLSASWETLHGMTGSYDGRDTPVLGTGSNGPPRQSVAAGWANAPTRPWAFGSWFRGDGETNYRTAPATYGEGISWKSEDGPDGLFMSTYGKHAHIYFHTSYAQQRYQAVPKGDSNPSISGSITTNVTASHASGTMMIQDVSGTFHPSYNFLGDERFKQLQFYAVLDREHDSAQIVVQAFMHNSSGSCEAWYAKRWWVGSWANTHAYNALVDGRWHHWAYAQHPNAGRNIYEHLTESASNRTWEDLKDGSASQGNLWSYSSGSVNGTDSQTFNDDSFNGYRVFVDGIMLENGYSYSWKSPATGSNGGSRWTQGLLWRCPTITPDNGHRILTSSTRANHSNRFERRDIHFVGCLGHAGDSESRRVYPFAEPTFWITQVTSPSGSINQPWGCDGSADISGSFTEGQGTLRSGSMAHHNGLPDTSWWLTNVWTGNVFKSITGLSKIKSLSAVSGETMKNALHDMNVQVPGHYTLDRDHVSPARGMVYDNTEYGIDSLTFGGLKK